MGRVTKKPKMHWQMSVEHPCERRVFIVQLPTLKDLEAIITDLELLEGHELIYTIARLGGSFTFSFGKKPPKRKLRR